MDRTASPLGPSDLVTVIGGSGFLGRYIVQRIAETGARVRVAVRHVPAANFLKPLGALGQVSVVRADVGMGAGLAAAFEGATAGVNLVGILDERGRQRFDAVQARGAKLAAEAAAAAGVRAYVQMSAIGADAASPVAYARTKAEGEAAVLAALPFATVLRPSLVVGPEDQFLNRFAAMAVMSPVLPVISGDSKFQPVYVLDVAAATLAALESGAARGRTYALGGPDVMSFRAILAMINRETQRGRMLLALPDVAAKLMGRVGDVLPFVPMTSDQFAMLQKDNVVQLGEPGLEALGVTPTPMASFVPAMLARYRPSGRFAKASSLA
ncbi:MAG: complex I NDUFA9 subunit family protein [Polymorphobacter sp.]|uniref:complex I NDUFA9 subunit family protein n=1 Tax=Polymorphobacter sp. TaxID=1909290 RepID=UPI003A853BFE